MKGDMSARHRKIASDSSDDEDDLCVHSSDSTPLIGQPISDDVVLQRHIGILGCIFFVVGTTIGSGIFIAPKGVLENAGSVGWALVVWILSGLVCGLGGLCYAELGATFTKSGGDFTFILENFGPLLAFLRVWTSIIAVRTASSVVVAITAAVYLLKPFYPSCQELPDVAVRLISAFMLCAICVLNCRSSSLGSRVQGIFTIAKLIGLLVIGFSGFVLLCQGKASQSLFTFSAIDPTKLPLAFYSGLFAYSGFQYLPQITEEIINPTRTIPIGIIISMVIITTVYLLANMAYFIVLTPEEILTSDAVALDYGRHVLGSFWWTLSVAVTLSCIGSCNGVIFTTPRMFFAASRERLLPEVFGMIHINWKTPLPAIASMLPVMLLMFVSQDIFSLINYFSFMRWTFIVISVAVIPYSRWKYPHMKRPFKVPLILVYIFMFACFFIVSVSLYSDPYDCGVGLLLTLTGIPVYYFGVWWENKPQWMRNLFTACTHILQKIFYVVPQENKVDNLLIKEGTN